MVSYALDDRQGSGVADGETLPRPAGGKERAAGRPVESDIAENYVQLALARCSPLAAENQLSSAKTLADKIVGHALQHQLHAGYGEGSERLTGHTGHLEVQRSLLFVQAVPHQLSSQARA